MLKKKIRSLQEMPAEIKLQYFKILFIMARVDGELNQLELMELYRLMGRVKLLQKQRLYLLNNIEEYSKDSINICTTLLEALKDQERNILRFSLIKDLIIIMLADDYESLEEKKMFTEIQSILEITEEQLEFFQGEYKQDKIFFDLDCTLCKVTHRGEERILTAMAMGIPVGVLYLKEKETKKDYFFLPKGRKELLGRDVLKAITLGVISYQGLKWLFQLKRNKEQKLKQLLYKESVKIQERAMRYLVTDKSYFQQKLLYMKEENEGSAFTNNSKILLDKTHATLQNSKPSLL